MDEITELIRTPTSVSKTMATGIATRRQYETINGCLPVVSTGFTG